MWLAIVVQMWFSSNNTSQPQLVSQSVIHSFICGAYGSHKLNSWSVKVKCCLCVTQMQMACLSPSLPRHVYVYVSVWSSVIGLKFDEIITDAVWSASDPANLHISAMIGVVIYRVLRVLLMATYRRLHVRPLLLAIFSHIGHHHHIQSVSVSYY